MNSASIVALLSGAALAFAPVRQLITRRRYWRVARIGTELPDERERQQIEAARDFVLNDFVRWNLWEALSTVAGVVLLVTALMLELRGG
jgi:hypothetical protein